MRSEGAGLTKGVATTLVLAVLAIAVAPMPARADEASLMWCGQVVAEVALSYRTSPYRWPGVEPLISYSYSNLLDGSLGLPTNDLRAAVEEALGVWAAHSPLHFVEVPDTGPTASDTSYLASSHANIRIGHHYIDGASGSNVLAHAYYPTGSGLGGDLHFDNSNTWRIGPGSGYSFLEVTVHELGHALGLDHEPLPADGGNEAAMNPKYAARYFDLGAAFVLPDDINGIQAIYGSGKGSVTPLPEPTTFSMLAVGGALLLRRRRRRQAA